jgi:hypothetical protein
MSGIQFPQNCQIVQGLSPQVGAGAAVVADYISVKNAQKVWCVIQYNQADGNAITWKVERATAVDGTGHVALANVVPIWSNLDTDTSDLLVKRTAAITYATDAGATDKIVIFEIDPTNLGSTYDVIAVSSTTVIAVGQYVSMFYIIEPRYGGSVANIPSYITD